jgi:hypothetical protein
MAGRIKVSPKEERTIDGRTFASKAEMNRYLELKMAERAGVIFDLRCQPKFLLIDPFYHPLIGQFKGLNYLADFGYFEKKNPKKEIIEDVKGHITEIYSLKRTLLVKRYPDIDFREIKV